MNMDYNINFNGFTIPVSFSEKMNNRCNLYTKWDVFEIVADPKFTPEMVQDFLESRQWWMDNHLSKFDKDIYNIIEYIDKNNTFLINRTKEELRAIIKKYIKKHNTLGKVNKVYIRKGIRGRWASCSEKHNITFSDIMCYLPEHLIEYIVYHEMIHLTVRNHGVGFYKKMSVQYPDYSKYDKELDAHHYLIAHKEIDDKIKLNNRARGDWNG